MSHIVKCRICKQPINIDVEPDDSWVMPSTNFYYHVKCYHDWKASKDYNSDEDWIDRIYDFIKRDLKGSYNYHLCEAQRINMIKNNICNNKGIYFTLRFFYEIEKNDWGKSNGGIGIVPYVLDRAMDYWLAQERKQAGFLRMIEQQIREREQLPVKVMARAHKEKTNKWSLDDIK